MRVSQRLRERTISPLTLPDSRDLTTLTPGQDAVVTDLAIDDPQLAHRLLDLGFVPGTTVELIRRAPLGDPIVFRLRGAEICLRRAEATRIRVAAPTGTP